MRIGVVLPSFAWSPDEALGVAADAEAAGIDGVFCYDHLWPMGNRTRPALAPFPLLGVIAHRHPGLVVGPLVARIGLVSNQTLVAQFAALEAIAPGRVIAAIGTGDRLSAQENQAYGVEFAPADERRDALGRCATELKAQGLEVWIGGGAQPTLDLAGSLGCVVNLWGATAERVAEQAARTEVSWAGLSADGADEGDVGAQLAALRAAGATWAVFGLPVPLGLLGNAARG